MKKKVLFVTPSLGMGGTNPSLEALYNHIKDLFDIQVFAIAHQSRVRQYSFDEVLLPQNRPLSMLYTDFFKQKGINKVIAFVYKSIQSLFRYINIDLKTLVAERVVKSLESCYSFDTVVAYQEGFATQFVSYFHKPNKIAWIHCNYDNWMPKDKSELTLYSKYKTIVCVSEYTASIVKKRYPLLHNRVVAIYNLVEITRIQGLGNQPIDDCRFTTEGFILLSAGRFNTVKRFREIPRIASELKKRYLQFHWYIIGYENDESEMNEFQDGLQRFDVFDCVTWLGGKTNPYPYFKAANIYVCTSESEACPMVFYEAKLFGLPIVTTDFPSAYEFIIDGETGIVLPFIDIENGISKLINDKDYYFRIISNIKQLSFDNDKMILKIKSII